MVSKKLTVRNEQGFHMRTASEFADAMNRYPCRVTILFQEKSINAKSILNLMAACITCGSTIELICEGEREEEALAEGSRMIEA